MSREEVRAELGLTVDLTPRPPLQNGEGESQAGEQGAEAVAELLAATVGLPYFLLSSTSPLVQAWYARRVDSPYRLFALSNLWMARRQLMAMAAVRPRSA